MENSNETHQRKRETFVPVTPSQEDVERWMAWQKDKTPEEVALRSAQLEKEAYFDPNTGLYNRRGGVEKINTIPLETIRQEIVKNAAILFADLDGLKRINDTEGHPQGDAFIQTVADIFKEFLRETDIKIRWGGDEFVLLLPNCNRDDAHVVVSRLRDSVIEKGYSVTIGVAGWDPSLNAMDIIEQADRMVNEIKHAGLAPGERSDGVSLIDIE